jgi:hypothetical protein
VLVRVTRSGDPYSRGMGSKGSTVDVMKARMALEQIAVTRARVRHHNHRYFLLQFFNSFGLDFENFEIVAHSSSDPCSRWTVIQMCASACCHSAVTHRICHR